MNIKALTLKWIIPSAVLISAAMFYQPVHAASAADCSNITLTVVNNSSQTATIRGYGDKVFRVPAHDSEQFTYKPQYFYTRCNRISVTLGNFNGNATTERFSLINPEAAQVSLRINADGSIAGSQIHPAGFHMQQFIQWHGMKSVL